VRELTILFSLALLFAAIFFCFERPDIWKRSSMTTDDVRFGSKADICSAKAYVRSYSKSGHVQRNSACLLCAKSGRDTISPEVISQGDCETFRPTCYRSKWLVMPAANKTMMITIKAVKITRALASIAVIACLLLFLPHEPLLHMGYSLRKFLSGVLSLSNGHVFDTVLPNCCVVCCCF
jgi:hypothetical protein